MKRPIDSEEGTKNLSPDTKIKDKELSFLLGLPKDTDSYVLHPFYTKKIISNQYDRNWIKLNNINEKEYALIFGRINKNLEKLIKEGKLSEDQITKILNERYLSISIFDEAVSSNHFSIGRKPEYGLQPEHFYVVDNGSKNGTSFNGVYYDINGKDQKGNFKLIPKEEINLPENQGESAIISFGEKKLDVEFVVYKKKK